MRTSTTLALAPLTGLSLMIWLASCSATPADQGSAVEGTGAKLSVDYFGDTDVVGFHFEIERVACDPGDAFEPYTTSANVDLVDGVLPGNISLLEQTLDPDSNHLGSDLFMSLAPGCYDVVAAPASAIDGDDWTASEDCSTASYDAAEVVDGATTEILLLSQCVGDEMGALDSLVVLNHPPLITVEIDEKFDYECEAVEACITVYDVDDDPLDINWEQLEVGGAIPISVGSAEIVGYDDGHRIWQQCATIVPDDTGTSNWQVTVYDLGYESGALVTMESLVDPEDSHDDMTFPIHTLYADLPLCMQDGEAVQADGVDIVLVDGCETTSAEEYYCVYCSDAGLYPDVVAYVCDEDGHLIESALYPDCPTDGGSSDGGSSDDVGSSDDGGSSR